MNKLTKAEKIERINHERWILLMHGGVEGQEMTDEEILESKEKGTNVLLFVKIKQQ